jgi:hypothetical protein
MRSMNAHAELSDMARRAIDVNHTMTLATQDRDGRPRLSPVYLAAQRGAWPKPRGALHDRVGASIPVRLRARKPVIS